ncbi:MAG: aspartate-semialdehyde dehydrogenase, partial [Vicingaceae bacterium]
ASILSSKVKVIDNPICSNIQMVIVMNPLHKKYKIKRVVVSTYQSITGTGVKAVKQLENEKNGIAGEMAYPYPIDQNCLPHCDVFEENGYTKEEMKLVNEPKKIMGDVSLNITATAVRVPVVGGHSESLNIEFENDFDLGEVRKILHETDGITLQDNIYTNTYPMPIYAKGKDDVFVGRIRKDESQPNTLNMWVVTDNLRKGAATNAVQIAEYLAENNLI